jgi:DNA-binding NarL/FixJ family response regulator
MSAIAALKSEPKATPPSRRRVFLVDDHPLVRDWLAGLVAAEPDLQVCGQAEDAAAALAAVPPARPDIVVLDLSLPRGSGLELLKALRAKCPAVRLLVLSMHDEAKIAERAFRAGAQGYAVKSESSPHIIEAIRAVLAGKFYATATLATQLTERMLGGLGRRAEGGPDELLSDRELEVFRMRGEGRSAKEIAERMRVSVKTVGSYDERIKTKLGLDSTNAVTREAVLWHERQRGL